MSSYVLEQHAYGRWLTLPIVTSKFPLLWSVKPCFCCISHRSLSHPEPVWSHEAEEAIQSLDKQLKSEPRFQQTLRDATLPKGATAQLTCLVNGRVAELWYTLYAAFWKCVWKAVTARPELASSMPWFQNQEKLCPLPSGGNSSSIAAQGIVNKLEDA